MGATKADMWSIGVAALELLTGQNPFRMENRISTYRTILLCLDFDEFMTNYGKMSEWCSLSPSAQDFVRSLLTADSIQRPSASQALRHWWLTEHQASCDALAEDAQRAPDSERALPHWRSLEISDDTSRLPNSARASVARRSSSGSP